MDFEEKFVQEQAKVTENLDKAAQGNREPG